MLFEIKSWLSGKVLFSLDCESLKICVEAAVNVGASLDEASLDGARLNGARLNEARLVGARLDEALLNGARLDGALLDRSSLVGASLVGASFVRASLDRASFDGARLSWTSHDLLAEILLREAGDDVGRRSFAGLILVSRDWCWDTWLKLELTAESRWAARVLAKWIHPNDKGAHIGAIQKLAAESTA